nr:hypothetical protein [Tanacetum cinerariifolium]
MCEMVCQIVQKKQEEKRIEEEQAANAQYWKIPACCDDDDDYNSEITPNEPVDSLIQVWGELGEAQQPKTSASWEAPHAYP